MRKVGLVLLGVGSFALVLAAYMFIATRTRDRMTTPPSPAIDSITDLGDGWYAARESVEPRILKAWEMDMRDKGLTCRFMGVSRTNTVERNGGNISPVAESNLYLCRERAIPAQDCTVE